MIELWQDWTSHWAAIPLLIRPVLIVYAFVGKPILALLSLLRRDAERPAEYPPREKRVELYVRQMQGRPQPSQELEASARPVVQPTDGIAFGLSPEWAKAQQTSPVPAGTRLH